MLNSFNSFPRYDASCEDNVLRNKKHYVNGNCELSGLVVFIIAAGPSLKKNVQELKRIPKHSVGKIMAIDASISYLVENDIEPDFCISIDGDARMWRMLGGLLGIDTADVTLLCSIDACPDLVEDWRGPRYFFMHYTDKTEHDNKLTSISKLYKANKNIEAEECIDEQNLELVFEGIEPEFFPFGNVTGTATQFSVEKLSASRVVYAGLDFSWSDSSEFYVDGMNMEMGYERVNEEEAFFYPDDNGKEVLTNLSMMTFKKYHEGYANRHSNRIVNATEGGIFGVNQDSSRIDNIEFSTLKNAIDKYVFSKGMNEQ